MPKPRSAGPLIDLAALDRDLAALPAGVESRPLLLARLKAANAEARAEAERRLMADGDGLGCASRLSAVMDAIIAGAERAGRAAGPAKPPAMTVVAVGGYGRGTLAPGSDIDLLFLPPSRQTPAGEKLVEFILYLLWDLGLKVGHATRTVDDCIRLARTDMTIRTAILEARQIAGDAARFAELQRRFDAEIVAGSAAEFVAAKLAERDERHRRQGQSRYLLEPNVKDGKGGLRDLHTLFWIGKYAFRAADGDALVAAGLFSKAEYAEFRRAEGFLWAVRCHLHFLTGRPEERLAFEHQRAMAERLGYTAHPGLRDVERFMKHYFLVAKEVGDLTQIFCAALEERHVKAPPRLNRFFGLGRGRRPKALAQTEDFIVENDRISVAGPDVFAKDPVNILRIFHLADKYQLAFHPDATQLLTRSLRLIDAALRDNREANRLFLDVLISPRDPETVLRRMNESGVLGRFIPEFGKVVAMMQFGLYHHYTVDEHLLRAVGWLSRIERGNLGEEHPLSNEIVGTVADRVVLYVAVFLHDIAKGRPEDHSIAGARVARKLCPRLGLSASQTEMVAWLIEQHLTMSTIAQSRDLNDRKTILDFAAIVQSLERLKLLLILTVADIRAVGPGVWNGWKGQLLRTLYWETEPILTGGHSQVSRGLRVEAARNELLSALDWPLAERSRYVDRHYAPYLLRVDLPRKLAHAELVRRAEAKEAQLATDVRLHAFEEITEVTVYAPDHPRLLSIIAGACTAAGANIVDAQIYTTSDGMALDSIFVTREFRDDADEVRRAGRITALIEEVLSGRTRLPQAVAARAKPRVQLKPFSVATRIVIDNSWSNQFTAIEASGLDRPGLLYELTRALSDLNLNIGSAHIATFGERAVDVFYVTDLIGHKITNAGREAAIRKRLEAAFAVPDAAAEKSAARKPAPAA